MPSITKNIRLPITDRETNKNFLDWRLGVDGPEGSAFQKLDDAWGELRDRVNAVRTLVGSPAVATTAAGMTDTSKVYVYTGNEPGYTSGNWYYHNGEAWISGGVYQATAIEMDDTLTVAGAAADAAVVGRELQNRVAAVEVVDNKLHVYTGDDVEPDEYQIATDTYEGLHMEYDEETNLLHLYDKNDSEIGDPVKIIGGGGGGSGGGNNATLTVSNSTGWQSRTIPSGAACPISITWSSIEDENPTGNGTVKIADKNGVTKAVLNVAQGTFTHNVAPYLASGDNTLRVTVTDIYGNYKTIIFNIKYATFSLSSTFNATTAKTGKFSVAYTPSGGKQVVTLHHLVDGAELSTGTEEIRADGKGHTFEIPAQAHGAHTLEIWFDADIDGELTESNRLYYEFISVDASNDTPIISTAFRDTTAAQYSTLTIDYTVYSSQYMSDVTISANGRVVSSVSVDRTQHTFTYRADETGPLSIVIVCGGVSRTISVAVEESDIHLDPATDQLALYLTCSGRDNNEPNPAVWKYNDIEATFENFNFRSDGWITEDGTTALRVGGDARVTIPYKPFSGDLKATGKTIEIEFSTHDVLNYDSTIVSCMNGNRGFALTAQLARLASEQSAISMQYKENEHVRIAFVAEKMAENRLLYIYVNGIMSGVVQYPSTDNFMQPDPVGITIGSNDCTVDVYCIRIYDTDLTREQVLNNWIADTQDIDEMLERYQRNNVYDEYGNIVVSKLPAGLPYLIIECPQLPQYKGDKKTVNVTYVDPASTARSFTATGAEADVQGTSSQFYPRKNYKIKFKSSGFDLGDGTHAAKYPLRPGAIPTNAFCYKADVASSEGANNVELARLYNDIAPFKTAPQKEDDRVRQGIDGFPIVIFWNDGTDISFIGKYNFNNDKGTEEIFGFADGDESWEIRNNNSDRVIFKSADFTSTRVDGDGNEYPAWLDDFEGRFPDGNEDPRNLKVLSEWLVSTDTTAAGLSDAQKAARLTKFHDELEQYMDKDAVIFYYLFTELFLMVDSRAKNAFPTYYLDENGNKKWFSLPYDFDTAIGINNEGALVFSYNLEDTDTVNGEYVYNGQNSVLWNNLRDTYYAEIRSMYQKLRSSGALSYEAVEGMFEEHQEQWGEAIFNEDAYFKYLQPLLNDGTATYLPMLQGSKAEQRKWWLYNRFRYMDSKYSTGDSQTDYISFRAYDNADVDITPYADIYASIKFGNTNPIQKRAARNIATTIENPLDSLNDTEITIYSASQIASLGDLSGLQLSTADFSRGTKLQNLKIGSTKTGYDNAHLRELHVGNNVLLREIDVRNCSGLGQAHGDKETTKSIDLSGCTNIERVYFDGTNILGVVLPDGGVLKTLHLPATVTNLTVLNQPSLTEFVIPSYANLSSVRLENVGSGIDTKDVVKRIPNGANVRLVGFAWEADDAAEISALYDILDKMKGIDENGYGVDKAQAIGTIHLDSITGAEAAALKARYPDITIRADHSSAILTYYNYDGSSVVQTQTIQDGGNGTYSGTPSRTATAQYTYTFVGWSTKKDQTTADANATRNVTEDRAVYAAYSRTTRTYTITWKNTDGTTLETDNNVPYGTTPTYNSATPVNPTAGGGSFRGWTPTVAAVTGNATYTASYTPMYNVSFYNGSTLIKTVQVLEGGTAVYDGTTPVDPSGEGKEFLGWAATNGATAADANILKNITANKSVYAAYASAWEDEEITDSWATIIASLDDGTYSTKYKLGNYKPLDLGTEGTINMQIVAMDTDEIAGSTYKAPLTMIGKELLATSHNMNATNTTSGGWKNSAMRAYLKSTILPLIPAEVAASIKTVTKYSSHYTNSAVEKDVISEDDLWIPSNHEVFGTTTFETLGPVYSLAFPDANSRKKFKVGASSASPWWLRSAHNTTDFRFVSTDGTNNSNSASNANGVALGFCLGSHILTESWSDIIASVNDGTYAAKYHVGDYKPLDLGTEGVVNMKIAAIDTDELADDSGNKAPITWISEELLKTSHRMNATNTTEGGWEDSEMRTYLKETVKPLMPEEVQNAIKTVKKYSRIFRSGSAVNNVETADDVWIPSSREVNFSISNVETLGPQYSALFPDNNSRKKHKNNSSSANFWWLRSAYNTANFRSVYTDGANNYGTASSTYGVALGFCT